MSWSDLITQAPPDAVFGVADAYRRDTDPNKINLSVGAYRDENGKPWPLPVVKRAEEIILQQDATHEYLTQIGLPELRQCAPELLFGNDAEVLSRVACTQSLSGTGALRLAGEFLKQFHPAESVYVTDPTWANHAAIFERSGFRIEKLRYYDPETRGLALSALLEDIEKAPENSILVLHTCAHNPTGVDPTLEQWGQIEAAVAKRKHTVIFDTAYQGYASGSVEKDAASLRLFASRGHEILVCQSFSKNLGLYGERVGTCCMLCKDADKARAIESRFAKVVRPMYSNPPKHPALVVATIMRTPELYEQWMRELNVMSSRILDTRQKLLSELTALKTPGTWHHITDQIGMFSYTGLSKAQVEHMTKEHHVYLLPSGRISMAGINDGNVKHLAKAIDDAVRKIPHQKL